MVTGVNLTHVKMVKDVIENCTGYVFLTEAMNDRLNSHHKPYVVIEGLCDTQMQFVEKKSLSENSVRKCMYAGFLDARYGVKMMVDGFLLADISKVEEIIKPCGFNQKN